MLHKRDTKCVLFPWNKAFLIYILSSKVRAKKIDTQKSFRKILACHEICKYYFHNNLPVCEDQHDPGVELGQRLRDELLSCLGEDGADQPEIERVGRQTEDVGVCPGPVLEHLAGAGVLARPLVVVGIPVGVLFNVNAGIDVAEIVRNYNSG